ncbi:hypothetical protein HERIO_74 [Hepatospora eriocheir]|uniref:Uncharacterized protein n=1 Tax=Hepatospora eriocheir TaxID=1081669 RepID=A0A1X0QE66_9MICR|nr:hypothetical protein HERIO_74 [Hepatospora eriocheir]
MKFFLLNLIVCDNETVLINELFNKVQRYFNIHDYKIKEVINSNDSDIKLVKIKFNSKEIKKFLIKDKYVFTYMCEIMLYIKLLDLMMRR